MPVSLTREQINEYSDKWLKGTITEDERKIFEQWYNEQPPGVLLWETADNETELKERIFDRVITKVRDEDNGSQNNKARSKWLLAASVLLAVVSVVFFTKHSSSDKKLAVVKTADSNVTKPVTYTRSILLPDGSTVILHANSSINYPEKFIGETREIELTGEAYFDIKHDSRPFIIHTGDVNTVVLGTAFNIKAYPDSKDVTVSVVRGKVRVENKQKVLAVLTPDEEITCNSISTEEKAILKKVNAAATIIEWTKQDMVFEDVSFQTVADLLARRYGVSISFKNPALAKCTIKAFFKGTEAIDKVVESLCLISNSVFSKPAENKILIDGEGCPE